jgi:phosphatidylglycerol:prolipoprotein diacylglycerol transferase
LPVRAAIAFPHLSKHAEWFLHYPHIDPVIIGYGPIAIRWYGLAYLAAFVAAWWLGNKRARSMHPDWTAQQISDVVFYGALGAVIGGRIGYVFFYGFKQFLDDPAWLLRIWDGGMSFHGGFLGVIVALALFARSTHRSFLQVADFVMPLVPLGLGFGRLGNFANTELPGRMTDSAFGVIYPCSADAIRAINPLCTGAWEDFARHPSPLYQAFAEGVVLFAIVWLFSSKPRPTGAVSGVFVLSYGLLRIATEFFREPDAQLGFIALNWLTMGQLLSILMVLFGIVLLALSRKRA